VSEISLIRLIAGSHRELKESMDLSPLQCIDRVQKLYQRFKDVWVGWPWLVLPAIDERGVYCLPATMPVSEMLAAIEKHGAPCGIVGLALLSDGKARLLNMPFRTEAKCRNAVNESADAAWRNYQARARQMKSLLEEN
jgi:hypothetical protein